MQLRVINSNSQGNSYLLENDHEALLIECGVRFDFIKKALNFNLSKVVGCLISHEHKDHCKSVDDVLNAGIPAYSSSGTHKAMGTADHHRSRIMIEGAPYQIGGFRVQGFAVQHDCAEPFGFLIKHPETGLILFLTDSYYVEYTFPGLNNIIIEANYSQDIVDDRVSAGSNPKFLRDRVLESHMSIDTCKKTLAANDLSEVNNILLIHLSDGNSDSAKFKREIEETTGKPVFIARPGLTIPFNQTLF